MKIIRKIIFFAISISIATLLLRQTYQTISLNDLFSRIKELNLFWIIFSVILGLTSHLIRAYRWKLLLRPLNLEVSLLTSFMTLMLGYMSNIFIPRVGEIVRCTGLRRATGIPIRTSLGMVALEHLIDFASFMIIVLLTFIFGWSEVKYVIFSAALTPINYEVCNWILLGLISTAGMLVFIIYINYNRPYVQKIVLNVKYFIVSAKENFYIIYRSKIKKIIIYTTIIKWLMYYLSDYVGLFSIPETSRLDWRVGLSVLTMSSLSFAIPIQGGIGAYHILVSGILVAYGITQQGALFYAAIIHAMHIAIILISGVIGVIFINFSKKSHSDLS